MVDYSRETASPTPANQGRVRVVLVEDNEDSRRSLGLILKAWGYHAFQAEDGVSGLEIILEQEPDVALIDIGLPGIDGLSLARRIRDELGGRIRLIAVTGYGQPEDRVRSFDAGFDFHLVKPVDLNALQSVLTTGTMPDGAGIDERGGGATSKAACPVCGGRLIEIRGKLQCSVCRAICETCCEGGRG